MYLYNKIIIGVAIIWLGCIHIIHAGWPSKLYTSPNKQIKKQYQKLHKAINENNEKKVKHILAKHRLNLNKTKEYHQTPLISAVTQGFLAIARHLIYAGADVNIAHDTKKNISILLAPAQNRNHIWSIKNSQGITPLFLATFNNDAEMAKLLLENGAYIQGNKEEKPPPFLLFAIIKHNIDMLRLLLEYGASINEQAILKNRRLYTVLSFATTQGHEDIIRLLLDYGALINGTADRQLPLHEAVKHNYIDIVRLYLKWHANPHVVDNRHNTPLHVTTNPIIAQLLIDQGADVHAQNKSKETPLHRAAFHGHRSIVDILITHDTDLLAHDYLNRTPAHRATMMGHDYVVHILNHAQSQNTHVADQLLKAEPEILIDKGCQLNSIIPHINHTQLQALLNSQYSIALYMHAYHHNIMHQIIKTHVIPHTWLFHAIRCAHYQVIKLLHAHPHTCNLLGAQEVRGKKALHVAAEYHVAEMFRFLLRLGASPRCRDIAQQRPYDHARMHSNKIVGRIFAHHYIVNRIFEHARNQYKNNNQPDIGMLPAEVAAHITNHI